MTTTTNKALQARSFLRSLNILLKIGRLYGLNHSRAVEQFEKAWEDLRTTLAEGDSGLLLGVSGPRVFVDGAPLDTGSAERSFAQMLSAAGLASIQFLPQVTKEDLACLVRAFPTANTQQSSLGEELKKALADTQGIRINEVRFVEESNSTAASNLAASLMSETLNADRQNFKDSLSDPHKLLELIAAAAVSDGDAGSTGGGSGAGGGAGDGIGDGIGNGIGGGGGGGGTGAGGDGVRDDSSGAKIYVASSGAGSESASDDEMLHVLRLLSRLGHAAVGGEAAPTPGALQQEMETLPGSSRDILQQALASLAAQPPAAQSKDPMLLRLAEHVALQFALDRYTRGKIPAHSVPPMLDRMSREIDSLRRILGAHEETMAQAGIPTESRSEILDRQFWAGVPEKNKREVLSSGDAWCIPARNLRQYVEELLRRGDKAAATSLLENYASCLSHEDPEARRRTAVGLAEVADLYAAGDAPALASAIRVAGVQLSIEREAELQGLISAAFVRLGQEAASMRRYPAVLQTLNSLDTVENQRPTFTQEVMPRLDLGKRLPEFIEEALRTAPNQPDGLMGVIAALPRPAAECFLTRFNRAAQRTERERLVAIVHQVGPEIAACLREVLQAGQPNEAAEVLGLLSRLDAPAVTKWIGQRLREWPRLAQDRALRVLAASGAPERGGLLISIFDQFDAMLQPLAVDEISMSDEPSAGELLMRLAKDKLPPGSTPFLRVKAIEALGRLRVAAATELLRNIVEAKKLWRWLHGAELRLTALHALLAISPDLADKVLPHSGLTAEDLAMGASNSRDDFPGIRQRRYARVRLATPMPATAASEHETVSLQVRGLSLGGGFSTADKHLVPGTLVTLRLGSGMNPIRARAFMRDSRAQTVKFEFADMDLEERARLRRFLRENAGATGTRQPQNPSGEPALSSTKS